MAPTVDTLLHESGFLNVNYLQSQSVKIYGQTELLSYGWEEPNDENGKHITLVCEDCFIKGKSFSVEGRLMQPQRPSQKVVPVNLSIFDVCLELTSKVYKIQVPGTENRSIILEEETASLEGEWSTVGFRLTNDTISAKLRFIVVPDPVSMRRFGRYTDVDFHRTR